MPMFIVRNDGSAPTGVQVKLRRRTPAVVASNADQVDWFCLGDPETARRAGHAVVSLHDGWYADDSGGGVTIFGPYWELRDTPFSVREAAPDPVVESDRSRETDEVVNVRKAIFGA
ncbi:MAG TPA: hypothetical protein VMU81_00595 [Acetobacteraceae bacterium]|jgi:hypothetical protein|nr:hypothetical protein [Acetobacteraceae bacterium]